MGRPNRGSNEAKACYTLHHSRRVVFRDPASDKVKESHWRIALALQSGTYLGQNRQRAEAGL